MKYRLHEDRLLRTKIERMTLRELIDQVCCPDVNPSSKQGEIPPSTAMVFLHPGTRKESDAAQEWIGRHRKAVLFAADMEDGVHSQIAGSFALPSPYALTVAGDPELAYKAGQATGQAGYELGYRWAFAPCVDLLLHPDSPMGSLRCTGTTPEQVIRTAGNFLRGLQDSGMAATIKHFPGDGATVYDHHLTTSENPLPFDRWMATYGKIYRSLIEEGVMTIMPGHISLPSYDEPDPELGICPPATLSIKLMTNLLRGELGFEGIVVSDALTMNGFSGFRNYYRACADFLKCGGDVLLFPKMTENFYARMEQLVAEGYLPLEVLRNRAYRAACFVQEMLLRKPIAKFKDEPAAITEEVVRRSVRVQRDRKGLLPVQLKPGDRILHVEIRDNYNHDDYARKLNEALKGCCDQVDFISDPGSEVLAEAAESGKYALIVCTCGEECAYGTNVIRLHGPVARNMMNGWMRRETPVIFVNLFHPFWEQEYDACVDTLINTYGYTEMTPTIIAEQIFKTDHIICTCP